MAIRRLPAVPNLENLKNQAKGLLSAFRDGDPTAAADFAEFHPRTLAPQAARLTDAQLVLARSYGQVSWPALADAVQDQLDQAGSAGAGGFPLDRAVNRRNVRNFLRAHAPEIDLDELELVSPQHGDSLEFTYGDRWLKVPKSGRAALLKEARLFEYMRQQGWQAQLPRAEFVHEQGLYATYAPLAGPRLSAELLQMMTAAQLSDFVGALAQFLSALHGHEFPQDMLALIPRGDDPFETLARRQHTKIQWLESTRFDTDQWRAQLERVQGFLHQRWCVIHCDPQLFRFQAVGGDFGQLGVNDLHDALVHDPAVDLGDFIAGLSMELPAAPELVDRIRALLLGAYETDDRDIAAKVEFMELVSEIRWAHIAVRAESKAAERTA